MLSAWLEVVNGVVKQNTVFNKYLLQKVIVAEISAGVMSWDSIKNVLYVG